MLCLPKPNQAQAVKKAIDRDQQVQHDLAAAYQQEEEARQQGLRFRTHYEDTTEWYSSFRVALPYSGFKTLIEEGTGRILGAHLLGPLADEVSNLFGLAIRYGLTAKQLEDMPYAYPTSGSDIWYMV